MDHAKPSFGTISIHLLEICRCSHLTRLAFVFFPSHFLSIRAFSQAYSPNDGIAIRAGFCLIFLFVCFQSSWFCYLYFFCFQLRPTGRPPIQAYQLGTHSQPAILFMFINALNCSSCFCLSDLAATDPWFI